MLRVNSLPPEQIPRYQRDFPRRELPGANARALALMVAWYLVAMFAGILLLGHLTAPVAPNTATIGVTLKK
jgi:hypothetical protein